jgi:nucleoid DNA-binding protein
VGRPSVKRQLAARVAGATGMDSTKVELILSGFYQEMLRAANEHLPGAELPLVLRDIGRFERRASRRGCRCPNTGRKLDAHWSFRFRPYGALVKRTAEVCAGRGG